MMRAVIFSSICSIPGALQVICCVYIWVSGEYPGIFDVVVLGEGVGV